MNLEFIIKEITLLNKEEQLKYKHIIPSVRFSWLRSHGNLSCCAHYVDGIGYIGESPIENDCGVRPALRVFYKASERYFKGDKLHSGKYSWTVLESSENELFILCDENIKEHRFDVVSSDWEASELKEWLETVVLKLILNDTKDIHPFVMSHESQCSFCDPNHKTCYNCYWGQVDYHEQFGACEECSFDSNGHASEWMSCGDHFCRKCGQKLKN